MMLRAKIFLLWLLALAIPVQGSAAVLQSCAPAMLAAKTQQQQQHQQHVMHAMNSADMQHGQHAQAAHHTAHAAASAQLAAADQPADLPTHHASASCSYCAACTVGAILPLALASLPVPDLPSHDYLALPAAGFVGHLPELPDRPPALA